MVLGTGAVVWGLADLTGKRTHHGHSLGHLPSPLPSHCFPEGAGMGGEYERERQRSPYRMVMEN